MDAGVNAAERCCAAMVDACEESRSKTHHPAVANLHARHITVNARQHAIPSGQAFREELKVFRVRQRHLIDVSVSVLACMMLLMCPIALDYLIRELAPAIASCLHHSSFLTKSTTNHPYV